MTMMLRSAFTLILALSLAAVPAFADTPGHGPVKTGGLVLAQADGPSLQEAVEQVRRQCQCRIVSAETRVSGNRETHIIKVLTADGTVKTHRIPGRSRRG